MERKNHDNVRKQRKKEKEALKKKEKEKEQERQDLLRVVNRVAPAPKTNYWDNCY